MLKTKIIDHLRENDVVVANIKVVGILAPIVKGLMKLKLCSINADFRVYWSYDKAMEDYNG